MHHVLDESALESYRRTLQERLWQVQSENAALKDTVGRLHLNTATECNNADSCAAKTEQDHKRPISPVSGTDSTPTNGTPTLELGGSMHGNRRALFHWSGVDFHQVALQRDQAVHKVAEMSFELEKSRCELKVVHAELKSASDKEDELMMVCVYKPSV